MLRPDISKAVDATPPNIREEITGPCRVSLELLNTHLAASETVEGITSAAAAHGGRINSLIAITDRRLLLVVPAPQVVAWRLSSLTKIQVFSGYFFLEGDAGKYSPGMASNEWGTEFEKQVGRASAIATLAGH
jgi:hypothetical protein